MTLTRRQDDILDAIRQHIREHGISPTIREIGKAMGIGSPNGVVQHLRSLEKKGAITRKRQSSRGIRLVGETCCPFCGHERAEGDE